MYGKSEKSATELETYATKSIRKLLREDPFAAFSARKLRKRFYLETLQPSSPGESRPGR